MLLVFNDPKDYSTSIMIEWLYRINAEFLIMDMLDNSDFIDIVNANLSNPTKLGKFLEMPC